MSKENHFIKDKKAMRMSGQHPRRSVRSVFGTAWRLVREDIRAYGLALAVIAGYLFFCMKCFYSSCPVVMLTGFPCPGCGLTRAGIALLRFQFVQAFQIHPMIYPIAALATTFFICRYFLQKPTGFLVKYVILLLIVMGIFYVYRMIKYFPDQEPMTYYYGAVFRFL